MQNKLFTVKNTLKINNSLNISKTDVVEKINVHIYLYLNKISACMDQTCNQINCTITRNVSLKTCFRHSTENHMKTYLCYMSDVMN